MRHAIFYMLLIFLRFSLSKFRSSCLRLLKALRINLLIFLNSKDYTTLRLRTHDLKILEAQSPKIVCTGIPRVIHIVWVGDQSKIPAELIKSWYIMNPSLKIRIWNNQDFYTRQWFNHDLLHYFWNHKKYESVADLMRYEILYTEGGFAVDADTLCVKSLPSYMFELASFTCFENELAAPGLLSNGYLATHPNSTLLRSIIISIANDKRVKTWPGWIILGPGRLTSVYRVTKLSGLTIFPSYYFIPEHYSGAKYLGDSSNVYARQFWGTTLDNYSR